MPSKISELDVSSVAAIGQRWRASLDAQNKSPRTIESYLAAVDALSNFLSRAGMPTIIANIRREHVESFITARQRELTVRGAPRSVNSVGIEYRSLRVLFGYAVGEGEVKESPMARMHPPRSSRTTKTTSRPRSVVPIAYDSVGGGAVTAVQLPTIRRGPGRA